MKLLILLLFGIVAACSSEKQILTKVGSAEKVYKKASFLPENNYSKNNYYANGEVTEEDFNIILDAADEIYSPIIADLGGNLVINRAWQSKTVNAYAERAGDKWIVSFYGGLARHPEMSFEGFALVVCHELFHHLGGAVLYPDSDWAAVEGQADYGAVASCARKMFDPSSPLNFYGQNRIWKKRNPPSEEKDSTCESMYANPTVCKMSLDGGLSLGRVLASLSKEPMPTYQTMDLSKIKKTQYTHPKASCRLASYYGGAVCQNEWDDTIIPSSLAEAKRFQCTQYLSCWLNEKNL